MPERSPWLRDSDLFTTAELALVGSPRPIALTVRPTGELSVVEVTPTVITAVVGGPHVDTVTGGEGIGFWFNAVDQHRHRVNKMATLLLLASARLSAHDVPLLYGPVLVASHDVVGGPAGLTKPQIRLLGGGRLSLRARWTLQRRASRDGRRRRRVWGPRRNSPSTWREVPADL